jgi:hypothetical protein
MRCERPRRSRLCRFIAAPVVICIMSTAAMADGPAFTIGFEGGFLFGDDHVYINEQPEYPGDVNHGDGATGALRIEGRQGMWAGFLDVRYWAGKDEATGVRSELSQIFGLHTITDTAETSARFTTIDLGIRRHVPTGGAELSFIAGLRFLSASHDNDERAITEGFFAADTLGRDRVDYWGVGPRIGVGAEGPIGSRFSWFGEVAATVLFGEMDVERRLRTLAAITATFPCPAA